MKKRIRIAQWVFLLTGLLGVTACQEDFLEVKPSSDIVQPTTPEDFQQLLDNANIFNYTAALPQMAADEYFIYSREILDGLVTATQRNSYTWEKDLYGGEVKRGDWNTPYSAVFYANSVLDGLEQQKISSDNLRGWALFARAYNMFNLASNFAVAYDEQTAASDLGIPIRLHPEVDVLEQRATLKESFGQILTDLLEAAQLLDRDVPQANRNRPSKAAAFGMLARVYLYMRDYEAAERYADSSLLIFNKLIDYNTVSQTSATPFSYNTEEVLYVSRQIVDYSSTTSYSSTVDNHCAVDTVLMAMYEDDDLRRAIFFRENSQGYYNVKRGYLGGGLYPFSGIATDEIFLIKAECAARRVDFETALVYLNDLLSKRHRTGTFKSIQDQGNVLELVINERRKELVWRGLRWLDIKRLNKEGAGIRLSRDLDGDTFVLEPNSPNYVFPIPDDEVSMSGLIQNERE